MKNTLKLLPVLALFIVNSCSFSNKSTVTVPINSNPTGAIVMIDGKNYGQTPAFVELTPNKNYKTTISKRGYGSANINMDTQYSMRGGKGGDGGRCMADVGAFVLPYFIVLLFAPEKCGSFKQDDYFVDLSGGNQSMPDNFKPQSGNQNSPYSQSNGQPNAQPNAHGQTQYQNNNYYGNQPQSQNNGYGQQGNQYGYGSPANHPAY
jgi:hypothetical protein